METTGHLAELASAHALWREAAEDIVHWGIDMEDVVADEATRLVSAVKSGYVVVDELRQGVAYANALDGEASRLIGSNITIGPERIERTARRVMHHAGRTALKKVNTRQKQTTRVVESNLAYRTSVRGDLYELRHQVTDI